MSHSELSSAISATVQLIPARQTGSSAFYESIRSPSTGVLKNMDRMQARPWPQRNHRALLLTRGVPRVVLF